MRTGSPLQRSLAAVPALLLLSTLAACGEDDPEATGNAEDTTSASESASSGESTGESTEAAAGECAYVEDGTGGADLPGATPAYDGEGTVQFATTIGDFTATLDGAAAPCTVNSFASLAEQGYFDDTTCHRMTTLEQFKVLQCGDPTATGTGGPGYTIPDEYDGSETYSAGTLAMARTAAPNSGGSQFFIVYGDTALSPEYTVFGTVDSDAIDAISEAAKAGVTPQMGEGDGTPNTEVRLTTVSLG